MWLLLHPRLPASFQKSRQRSLPAESGRDAQAGRAGTMSIAVLSHPVPRTPFRSPSIVVQCELTCECARMFRVGALGGSSTLASLLSLTLLTVLASTAVLGASHALFLACAPENYNGRTQSGAHSAHTGVRTDAGRGPTQPARFWCSRQYLARSPAQRRCAGRRAPRGPGKQRLSGSRGGGAGAPALLLQP